MLYITWKQMTPKVKYLLLHYKVFFSRLDIPNPEGEREGFGWISDEKGVLIWAISDAQAAELKQEIEAV